MNPFLVLGISVTADDKEIRKAYLEAVKIASPEAHPQRFKALNEAYEKIKDEPSRLNYCLFNKTCAGNSPADAFLRYARHSLKPRPLRFEAMKEFLRSCAKS
ncbi:MAG: DnaJ domain-containing protein [Candidatus Omnitrophica bacterium]|nr:DnaJ domain-containing protein [Candidatus Omnitrophota bacterium]